jgi:predicted aldo/keto reductase-like oxidoreductase
LDDSLRRLGTDSIDLLQFHNLEREEEPRRIFSEGAIEAAMEARDAGKIRFIGFTGHYMPSIHRQMLEQDFAWDTIQFPVNPLDAHYFSFTREILPLAAERNMGIIGMKSLAAGDLLKAGVSGSEAIRYALSFPIGTLVVGMESVDVLRKNLEVVRSMEPMSQAERDQLVEAVATWAVDGRLETYKPTAKAS